MTTGKNTKTFRSGAKTHRYPMPKSHDEKIRKILERQHKDEGIVLPTEDSRDDGSEGSVDE
tara:strand:- start:671 stop:853 length:183 start_codon:yes stop_codon:yes gene_type:complete